MLKSLNVIALLFLLIHLAEAQKKLNFNWGEISEYEKTLTECEYDSSVNAIILYDIGKLKVIGTSVYLMKHRRIKIFNRKGFNYANVVIPFYSYEDSEAVFDLKAQTLLVNSSGRVIPKSLCQIIIG